MSRLDISKCEKCTYYEMLYWKMLHPNEKLIFNYCNYIGYHNRRSNCNKGNSFKEFLPKNNMELLYKKKKIDH